MIDAGNTSRSALSRNCGRIAFVGAASMVAAMLGGCPNPAGKFDDFVNRESQIDFAQDTPDMALPPSHVFDITGSFLLSLAPSVQLPAPLQFVAVTTLTKKPDGTALLDLEITPLAYPARTPVLPSITSKGNVIAADGSFSINLGMQTVVNAANPLMAGDIVADKLTLVGTIRSKDRFCGSVTGLVSKPLMFDLAAGMGSRFAGIRISSATLTGDKLPAPDVSCNADVADGGAPDDMTALPDMTALQDMTRLADMTPTGDMR